jgi:hypothetical protein
LGKICAEIREIKDRYKNIILLLSNKLNKSNFWTSMFIFHYLNDIITHVTQQIQDTSFIEEKSLIVIPDDSSYSGIQITTYSYNARYIKHDILFAIPYISKAAKKKIISNLRTDDNKILLCDSTIEFEKYKNKLYPIYFDHKLADSVSTFQLTYALGRDEVTGDPNFKYEPMSLIRGCELYKEVDDPETLETGDILDIVKEKMCPPPFYKYIQYTFRGKVIENLEDLF